jgi:hypothetical protein
MTQITASFSSRPPVSGDTTKEGIKDIAKAAKIKAVKSPAKSLRPYMAGRQARMTEAIIGGSLLGIAQDLIGLVDFLELLLSHPIPVAVGMVTESHPSIGFLYFFVRRPPTHVENLVVVAFSDHDVNY